jgi:adenylate kinase
VNKPPKREGLCDKCNSPLVVREDDKPETIRESLRVFRENTQPVVDYYSQRGQLVRVDASREPEAVFQDILSGLGV